MADLYTKGCEISSLAPAECRHAVFCYQCFVLLISLNKGRETTAVNFAVARAFRIYPAHMIIVVAWFLLGPWLLFGDARHSLWDLAQNLTLVFDYNYVPMNRPTWSLRVEIAAVPLILLAWFIRTKLGALGLAFLAAILAGLSFARGLYFQDMIGRYLFVFVFGMLIPDLIRPLAMLPRFVVTSIICAAIAVDIALLGYHAQASILVEAICCTAALALIVEADSSFLTRFLHHRTVRQFGRISYSYFLIHFPVLWAFLRLVPDSSPLPAVAAGLLAWAPRSLRSRFRSPSPAFYGSSNPASP